MLGAITQLPTQPGVYQYFDNHHRLLYVGKAKNLRHRVKSYWRFTPDLHPNPSLGPRLSKMLHESSTLEYIVVTSEEDALILENSLIKQLKPKYNILLRDDKTYPYLYLDESQEFPRFELTRKVVQGKQIRYYGPFPHGGRALLDALYEIYPLIQKKSCLRGKKACLFHQIGKCLAPCEGKISSQEYRAIIEKAKESIRKRHILLNKLEERMIGLAGQERFEEAAKIRDRIEAIRGLKVASGIDLASDADYDIIAVCNGEDRGVIVRLFMRAGKIISSDHSFFRDTDLFDRDEAYRQALLTFYTDELPRVPREILVAHDFASRSDVATILSKRFGKSIALHHPRRGSKRTLTTLSLTNADELLRQQKPKESIEEEVRILCALQRVPVRVEVFDNSHMMGTATVGGMVVYDEGQWDKNSYRRFRLESKDEYAQMHELLEARITRFDKNSPPDLWVVDGGEANLRLALGLLKDAGVNLDVVAIAKEKLDSKAHRAKGAAHDRVHTTTKTFDLKPSDKRLQWLQMLRDEAHRFAISYHRNIKRREDTKSALLEQKGVGKATVKKLINYFGTFENISRASYDEICTATNQKVADILAQNSEVILKNEKK